jgi:hypothetical protein
VADTLRRPNGQFMSHLCPDPNCGGELVVEREEAWRGGPTDLIARCDGLTHETDDGPLIACATREAVLQGEADRG